METETAAVGVRYPTGSGHGIVPSANEIAHNV